MKRMTIRLVDELAGKLANAAKKRGISMNAMIADIAWRFVEDWNEARDKRACMNGCGEGNDNEKA